MAGDSLFGSEPSKLKRLAALGFEGLAASTPDPSTSAGPLIPLAETPGDWIGPYKLLSVLGEGGMGMVYLAEQARPVRRLVALEIVKPGMDSKRVLARFEAEQQTLARMEHPYVARVYDAGLAPSGRPYFVMEHVKGIPLTEHCDKYRLTIEQRLQLFLHVCEGVQHAHQKGIIHRDIKPSNILVMIQDRETIPKVIDFGVARAMSQSSTERTLYTEQGQLIGTPEYMSPEQMDLDIHDIDTRTDVYSLGVLLYELLTGMLPFDRRSLREGGLGHVRRVICEQDPKTPSVRLSGLSDEESAELARRRRTEPRMMRHKLRGDLDWITLKAMEKDRTRRYRTVDALAADIRNYLTHQAVNAAPPKVTYRASKFLQRHRQAAAFTCTFLVLLMVLLWGARTYVRTAEEHDRFEAFEHRQLLLHAQDAYGNGNWSDALAAIAPLLTSRHVGDKARLLDAEVTLKQQGPAAAIPRLQELLTEPDDTAGQAHSLLANIYYEGDPCAPGETEEYYRLWKTHSEKAAELIAGTAQYYFLQAEAASDVQKKLHLLARALDVDKNHYDSLRERAFIHYAQRDYDRMLSDAARMIGIRSDNPLGYSLCATAWRELGRLEEAVWACKEAIELAPDDPELYAARWETYERLNDRERALADIRRCVQLRPADTSYLVKLFLTLTELGWYAEAEGVYSQFLAHSGYTNEYLVHLVSGYVRTMFDILTVKGACEALEQGRALYPPDVPPKGAAFVGVYNAERLHANLTRQAKRVVSNGFHGDWSPDGTKLVYSMGMFRSSALAVLDTETGKNELLVTPGKDPAWSPDNRHIAFVRIRRLLPFESLTGRTMQTFTYNDILREQGEIWMMDLANREIRHIARGDWVQWGGRSGDLYYNVQQEGTFYRISVKDPNARPVPVLSGCSWYPAISPDERYVADHTFREMRVTDLASRSVVRTWVTPPLPRGELIVRWSPDGRELGIGGSMASLLGLWIYDMETGTVRKVMDGPIGDVCWSRGVQRKLSITLLAPLVEVRTAELKSDLPTVESFDSTQTVQEHCVALIERCNRAIDADPNYLEPYHIRADAALWMGHEKAREYLEAFEEALKKQPFSVSGCSARAGTILGGPAELRERLLPLARMLMRKVAEKRGNLTGHCRYDQTTDAYAIASIGADIWDTTDDFHFAYKRLHGDGAIAARIDSIENVNEWTKAGVMIRSTLEPDCPNVMLLVTPSGRVAFQHRHTQAAMTYSTYTPVGTVRLPHWVRLTRRSNRFLGEHSCDGIHWQTVLPSSDPNQPASIEITMNETVYLGLAVTSHDATKAAGARISRVTVTGAVTPAGPFNESRDIGFPLPPLPNAAK
jgi:serine/threonine protein kinase/tetratricopeptide (TPR) repeat protein